MTKSTSPSKFRRSVYPSSWSVDYKQTMYVNQRITKMCNKLLSICPRVSIETMILNFRRKYLLFKKLSKKNCKQNSKIFHIILKFQNIDILFKNYSASSSGELYLYKLKVMVYLLIVDPMILDQARIIRIYETEMCLQAHKTTI